MTKKLLSVLLSTAMAGSLLAGCGNVTILVGCNNITIEAPAPASEMPAEEEKNADEAGIPTNEEKSSDEAETPVEEEESADKAETPADEEKSADKEAVSAWTADLSGDTGKVLNIYCRNEEFQSCLADHYPGYIDNGDGTGAIGDVKVNWVIIPDGYYAYQDNLDEALSKQANAADDNKVDMFLIEDDYTLKYVYAKDVCISMDDLGITDYMTDQYQYTKEVVTDRNGNVNGTAWYACPGLYIYRRSVAKDVFGTDDPEEIQKLFSDWDKFAASAQKLSDAGWKVVSGYDDTYRVFSRNVSGPRVVDGRIVIDDNIMNWVEQTKDFTDKGFNNKTVSWTDEWFEGASSSGDVFGYFGPDWFINYGLASFSMDDFFGEEAVGNGTWGDWAAIEGPQGYFWGGVWICAAQGSDNQGLAADIMYQLTCNPDVMKDIVTADNFFCNNRPLMEEMAASGTTNAFLGGENVLEKFCATASTISIENSSDYYEDISELFRNAMTDYFEGSVDLDTALENFYADVETKYPELTK